MFHPVLSLAGLLPGVVQCENKSNHLLHMIGDGFPVTFLPDHSRKTAAGSHFKRKRFIPHKLEYVRQKSAKLLPGQCFHARIHMRRPAWYGMAIAHGKKQHLCQQKLRL